MGGISEALALPWMAQEHGVQFILHGWNTAVGLAVDLHLDSPFIDEITVGGWKLGADSMLAIPASPGLELDPDSVKKYTGGEKLL